MAEITLSSEQDFFRPVDLQAEQVGRAALRKEQLALVLADVEDGVVAPRVVDEGNVHVAWQTLVHGFQALDQRVPLVLMLRVL